MNRFIQKTRQVIFERQKDILGSTLILAFTIIISRIFGILRYRTLTYFFTPDELDIFIASFRIPDFLFEMIITGALSAAFIPIFIKYQKNTDQLHKNISSIINLIFLSLFILIFVVFLLADFIVPLLTPGFVQNPSKIKTIVFFSRMLMISQLPLMVGGYIFSGMAQANRYFLITAIAPILYNIGIILGTIFLSPMLWITGPFVGVVIGAFLFFLAQSPVPFLIDFKYQFAFQKKIIHEFITLFLPRLFTVIATQIDLTFDLILSSLLGAGSYTVFFFSQHIQFFPVSFFGMSLAQASLPYLSDLYKEKKIDAFRRIFIDSILQMLFFSIPVSALLIFARTPIVRIFFGGKRFDFAATNETALTLSYFALSIPQHTIFYFLSRSFYAMHDTRTPFFINTISVIINILLSTFFVIILKLPVWSLALAFSISITINVIMLLSSFYAKVNGVNLNKLFTNTTKIIIASLISSLFAYPMMRFLDGLIFDTTRTLNVFLLLFITFSIFSSIYLFIAWFIEIDEIYIIGKLLIKAKEIKRKFVEIYTDVG